MTLGWEGAVREILTADDLTPLKTTIQKPRDIFFPCELNSTNDIEISAFFFKSLLLLPIQLQTVKCLTFNHCAQLK